MTTINNLSGISTIADDDLLPMYSVANSDARKITIEQLKEHVNSAIPISDITGLQDELNAKQDTLVSGSNIKTVNGLSLVGSGNAVVTSDLVPFTPSGTGAVATNVQAKLRERVSVKDFGAVGDGVADDTAAMNLAHATGKVIYYPSGTYKFSTLSTITSGGIIGDGRGYTTLSSTDTTTANLITFTGSATSPVFQDFGLFAPMSGNLPVKPSGAGIVLDAVSGEIGYSYFKNVTIAFIPTCVQFVEASYWKVDCCEFLGYSVAGLDINNTNNADSGDSVITGSLFNTPGSTGCSIIHRASGGLKVIGNKMLGGNVGYSMQFSGTSNTGVLLFVGNSVENMTSQCMTFVRSSGSYNFSNVVITGNEFAVGPTGIQDDASNFIQQVVIANNVFNLIGSGVGYGINLASFTDFVISGNTFRGNGGTPSAILINSGCTNGKIGSDNTFRDITTITNNSTTTFVEKTAQSGSVTTASSGWSGYGSALFYSPAATVTFPQPFLVAPQVGDIQITSASTNGAVTALLTNITTSGFDLIGISAVTNVAAVYHWSAKGII